MQLDWQRLFLKADGRVGRQEFWIGFAILFAAGIVLGWIPLVGFIVSIALCYAHVCLGSKRLHDMGKSGWLMLAPFLVGLVCLIGVFVSGGMAVMGAAMGNNAAATAGAMAGIGVMMLIGSVAFLINIGFLLWIGLTPGQVGENAYGPDPMETVAPAAPV